MCRNELDTLPFFDRELPNDSYSAEEGFPGLEIRKFSAGVAPFTQLVRLSEPGKLVFFLEFCIERRPSQEMAKQSTFLTVDISGRRRQFRDRV
jgi:hypothetical protein